jgi:hypothetical protein
MPGSSEFAWGTAAVDIVEILGNRGLGRTTEIKLGLMCASSKQVDGSCKSQVAFERFKLPLKGLLSVANLVSASGNSAGLATILAVCVCKKFVPRRAIPVFPEQPRP